MPEAIATTENIVDVVVQSWTIEAIAGSNATIVFNGVNAGTRTIAFPVPTAPWLVNHDLNYVPQVWITDLAGNQVTIETVITTSQIIARPNAPMTGYLHYR